MDKLLEKWVGTRRKTKCEFILGLIKSNTQENTKLFPEEYEWWSMGTILTYELLNKEQNILKKGKKNKEEMFNKSMNWIHKGYDKSSKLW